MALSRKTAIKGAILVCFIITAIVLSQNDTVRSYLSKDHITTLVESYGIWGPIIYIGIYVLGEALLFPASIFTAVGAIVFGTLLGAIYTIIGATLGAAAGFIIARTLGKEFAERVAGTRLRKYDEKIKENGFATIFYLRMIFFPFNILNYGAGLTKVKFWDFLLGTFLGIIPGTFILTFFISRITDIHSWKELFAIDIMLATALFIASFFIPSLVKRIAAHIQRRRKNQNNKQHARTHLNKINSLNKNKKKK